MKASGGTPRHKPVDTVLGRAIYTGDMVPDDALWVKVVESQYPHALIKRVDISKALKTPGVVAVLTAKDIPGQEFSSANYPDRPFLAAQLLAMANAIALVVGVDSLSSRKGS